MTQAQAPSFDPIRYKETTREQWQQAAEAWHRWGPVLESWLGPATDLMLDLAEVGPGKRVLDVAAGAGSQTIPTARRVGPGGQVLATDISPNILALAEQAVAAAGLTNVAVQEMDGEALDLPDGSFDAVISRVGLIYFPDQQRALAEMRRVLRPGGRVAAIVYSTPDQNQFFSTPVGIIRRAAGLQPPAPGQPGPFSLGAEGALTAAFERAGFTSCQSKTVRAPLRLASAAECVRFERESFGALHQMLAGISQPERDAAWIEVEAALRAYESPTGFEGPCELVVAVGTK